MDWSKEHKQASDLGRRLADKVVSVLLWDSVRVSLPLFLSGLLFLSLGYLSRQPPFALSLYLLALFLLARTLLVHSSLHFATWHDPSLSVRRRNAQEILAAEPLVRLETAESLARDFISMANWIAEGMYRAYHVHSLLFSAKVFLSLLGLGVIFSLLDGYLVFLLAHIACFTVPKLYSDHQREAASRLKAE
jgi:hypothetical protein